MRRLTAAVLLSCICGGRTFADVKDTIHVKSVELESVTVIGIKQEKRLLYPASVSVVGNIYQDENEIRNVRGLSSHIPNFFMPDYGTRKNSPVFIRGIGSKVQSPSVVFYVDGIPHFESSTFDFDLTGNSVVEVLRGPQGTLYGRNAIGGVVNIQTLSPLDRQYSRIKLSYGSRNDLWVSSSNNIKLCPNMGLSVDANYHHNDGFFNNQYTNRKSDRIDNGMGRLKYVWKMSPNWTAALTGSVSQNYQRGYPYGIYDEKKEETLPVNYDGGSGYRRTMASSGLNFSYVGNYLKFNSQTSFQYLKDHQEVDQDFTPRKMFEVCFQTSQRLFSQELTLRSHSHEWYSWMTGAFAFIQDLDKTVTLDNFVNSAVKTDDSQMPTHAFALYHQSVFTLFPHLKLTLGLRYDYEHSRMSFLTGLTPMGRKASFNKEDGFRRSLHFNQLTPKVSLQYNHRQGMMSYITIAKGYKTGGFNFTVEKESQRVFNPEYNWNYEAGTKFNLLNNRLRGELALFYIDWRNQQIANTVPGVGNVLNNAGHSTSKGWEISLAYRPVNSLEMTVNYGYTDARFREYVKGKNDFSGKNLPLVPKHTLSAGVRYDLPLNGVIADKMLFYANAVTIGPIYWQADNKDKQKIYTLLNLKVALKRGPVTWELWSRNTTDCRYNVYMFQAMGKFAQPGRPFAMGSSVVVSL